jgi:hypothetical protein
MCYSANTDKRMVTEGMTFIIITTVCGMNEEDDCVTIRQYVRPTVNVCFADVTVVYVSQLCATVRILPDASW